VPLVVIATVAVEALPRVRGIAFAPQLRRFEKAFPNHKTIELANTNHFFYGGRRPAEG
jgi:hypothetical protein